MNNKTLGLLSILVPFTAFTTWLCVRDGYMGFVYLAMREAWGAQMLLDLGVMMLLFGTWMVRDAKERGVRAWPWLVGCFFLGSPAALTYLIVREISLAKKPSLSAVRA